MYRPVLPIVWFLKEYAVYVATIFIKGFIWR